METWKILLISIAAAIVAGSAVGIGVGKYLVKRARSGRKRLLSTKERVVYAVCVLLGAASILVGVLYEFPSDNVAPPDGAAMIDGGMTVDGKLPNGGAVGGDVQTEDASGDGGSAAGEDTAVDGDTADDGGEVIDGEQYDLPDGEVPEDGGIAVAKA